MLKTETKEKKHKDKHKDKKKKEDKKDRKKEKQDEIIFQKKKSPVKQYKSTLDYLLDSSDKEKKKKRKKDKTKNKIIEILNENLSKKDKILVSKKIKKEVLNEQKSEKLNIEKSTKSHKSSKSHKTRKSHKNAKDKSRTSNRSKKNNIKTEGFRGGIIGGNIPIRTINNKPNNITFVKQLSDNQVNNTDVIKKNIEIDWINYEKNFLYKINTLDYENFDWNSYVENYDDLNFNDKNISWKHWISDGLSQRRIPFNKENIFYIIYENVFSWETYIDNYNDLKIHKIDNKIYAWKHWINWGIHEGRVYDNIRNFDYNSYLKHNPDLAISNINSLNNLWKHWISYGKKEERIINPNMDINNLFINVEIIYIITSDLIISIANNFRYYFEKYGFKVEIKNKIIQEEYINSSDKELYLFIYFENNLSFYPKKYIKYQIEQTTSSFFNDNYNKILLNADAIWDFSISNKDKYNFIPLKKIYYMPMPFYNDKKIENINYDNCEYDILFYGAENERRKKICLKIKEKYSNFKIGFSLFEPEKTEIIKKTKIILNLHYYENPALETCRINEILKFNKVIISEKTKSEDWYNMKLYENIVIFIEAIDTEELLLEELFNKINYFLNKENYENYCKKLTDEKNKLEKKIEYHFLKNILYFKNKKNIELDLKEDVNYCLHLLETDYRYNNFIKQNIPINYDILPALKYDISWVGCAFSFVNSIWNAKRLNLKQLTIFEDDCRFDDFFKQRYDTIKDFLNRMKEWDIFVGCIADIPQDTKINKIYKLNDMYFLEINKIHSMVFNIYNHSSYDYFLTWTDNNYNSQENQIDQYLKRQNLRIIITYPFSVSCLNSESTIWKKNLYLHYEKLFDNSLIFIKKIIDKNIDKIINLNY